MQTFDESTSTFLCGSRHRLHLTENVNEFEKVFCHRLIRTIHINIKIPNTRDKNR